MEVGFWSEPHAEETNQVIKVRWEIVPNWKSLKKSLHPLTTNEFVRWTKSWNRLIQARQNQEHQKIAQTSNLAIKVEGQDEKNAKRIPRKA